MSNFSLSVAVQLKCPGLCLRVKHPLVKVRSGRRGFFSQATATAVRHFFRWINSKNSYQPTEFPIQNQMHQLPGG